MQAEFLEHEMLTICESLNFKGHSEVAIMSLNLTGSQISEQFRAVTMLTKAIHTLRCTRIRQPYFLG
jgi:hypothetical protein